MIKLKYGVTVLFQLDDQSAAEGKGLRPTQPNNLFEPVIVTEGCNMFKILFPPKLKT